MSRPVRFTVPLRREPADRPVRRRLVHGAVGAVAVAGALTGLTSVAAGDPMVQLGPAEQVAATVPLTPVTLTAAHLAPVVGGTDATNRSRTLAELDLEERSPRTSRSAARTTSTDPTREAVLSTGTKGVSVTVEEDVTQVDPRNLALRLMPEYGLSATEFGCLDSLWISESDWDMYADNPTSTALGIPQALQSAWDLPADYATNPETQVRWGLWYINATYGSACSAWSFKQANNWY